MIIQKLFSLSAAVLLSSLFLTIGSVDRNSTSSQNQDLSAVEAFVKKNGCATNFTCPTGTLPFYYFFQVAGADNYEDVNVKDVTKWFSSNIGENNCDDENQLACMICVHLAFTETIGSGPERKLLNDFTINVGGTTSEAFVSGSDDGAMTIINRKK